MLATLHPQWKVVKPEMWKKLTVGSRPRAWGLNVRKSLKFPGFQRAEEKPPREKGCGDSSQKLCHHEGQHVRRTNHGEGVACAACQSDSRVCEGSRSREPVRGRDVGPNGISRC